ncbi:MAG: cyclic nucleotide-binding domain-containing protein [Magnetospirillum sp. WYHS-4]
MVQIEGMGKELAEHPFFDGMESKDRELLSGCAKNEVFDADEYVFREGEPADKFYLIRHGTVAVELHAPGHDPMVLETLRKGDIFGWSWMVQPYTWTFDVRAVELTRVISLDAKCLRGKLEKDHSLGYELFKRFIPVMAERVGAARLQLLDLYGQPAERRSRSKKK